MNTLIAWSSLVVWLPIVAGIIILVWNIERKENAYRIALFASIATFAIILGLFTQFDVTTADFQWPERVSWIPSLGINYALGMDGIALPLLMLTAFCTILVIGAAKESVKENLPAYLAAFLMMEGLMHGVFLARDAMLFYVFWEAMLIPMYLIVGLWGGPNRIYAAIKFFLYTFLGSVFMLVALIYMGLKAGSFEISALQALSLSLPEQIWIFIAFLLAFAVKIPMVPVHTWLPDAHVEAPTGGSVVLAAIMLKMGGYGFLRFSLPVTPDASMYLSSFMMFLSLVAVVYIGFVALVQKDMKKLVAYSSIAHMGFVTLGFFMVYRMVENGREPLETALGLEGAYFQMISHGLISAALFLCIGVLYDRMKSRNIADYGGVVNTMPKFAALMMLFVMANSGLPATSGFVGEFMVILASFKASLWIALLAGTTLVLGAAYSLWLYKRVIFGEIGNQRVAALTELTTRETCILSSLAVLVLWLGVYPESVLGMMHASIEHLIQQMLTSKL